MDAAAVTSSSTLLPIPTQPSDPNFGHLRIKNDVLYPKDETPYIGRDLHVRMALLLITQIGPLFAALFLTISRPNWWERRRFWTLNRLMAFWFLSVQLFGYIFNAERGATTRTLFLSAVVHVQVEYMIITLLLKGSGLTALVVAYLAGFVLFSISLFVEDLSLVFIMTTVSGFSDFMIPLLFTYGKQHFYAVGAWAHLVQVVGVFCIVLKNYGHTAFNVITFYSTWGIIGGYLAADIYASRTQSAIRLETDEANDVAKESKEASDNPLHNINIPNRTLYIMFATSIIGSFVSANFFVFVIAKN